MTRIGPSTWSGRRRPLHTPSGGLNIAVARPANPAPRAVTAPSKATQPTAGQKNHDLVITRVVGPSRNRRVRCGRSDSIEKGRRTGRNRGPVHRPTSTVGKLLRPQDAALADRLMAIDVVGRPLVTGHQITDDAATHRRRCQEHVVICVHRPWKKSTADAIKGRASAQVRRRLLT